MKKPYLLSIISLVLALGLWEIASQIIRIHLWTLTPPFKVVTAFWSLLTKGHLLAHIWASLWRQMTGLIIGVSTGGCIGILCGRFTFFRATLNPLIQLFRPIPAVAFSVYLMVFFGLGHTPVIISIALGSFFPVWLNTYLGALRVPQIYVWRAGLLTPSSFRIFQKVIFPATVPLAVAGIRTGIAISFIMVFVAESHLGLGKPGLGALIADYEQRVFDTDYVLASLAALGMVAALMDYLFSKFVHTLFPWMKFTKH